MEEDPKQKSESIDLPKASPTKDKVKEEEVWTLIKELTPVKPNHHVVIVEKEAHVGETYTFEYKLIDQCDQRNSSLENTQTLAKIDHEHS